MRLKSLVVLGVAVLAGASACDERLDPLSAGVGGGSNGTADFNITPATLSLSPGQSATLTLNTTRAIGPYTWTTNQPGVATVTNDGIVTAIGAGTANISVTAAGDRSVSARTAVTVSGSTSP